MTGRSAMTLGAVACAALVGCGDQEGSGSSERGDPGPGDSLIGQGVEIVDGRFVPDLVSVRPAQPVTFTNRDDVSHRIVKVSGPGRDFRSEVIEPGEQFRVRVVGRGGRRLGRGAVVYRSTAGAKPSGRIEVYGKGLGRDEAPEGRLEPPGEPDLAAKRRARKLAQYVSQCRDFRRCDTPAELVRNVGSGNAVRFVRGSGRTAVESAVATGGPQVPVGDGPDETEIRATRSGFTIVSHSRTGRDFVLRGRGRDPSGWSTRWTPESPSKP